MKKNFTKLIIIALLANVWVLGTFSQQVVKEEQSFTTESGIELKAGVKAWPDSAITYAATGHLSSKTLYDYNANGKLIQETTLDWTENGWVNESRKSYTYSGDSVTTGYYTWESNKWTKNNEETTSVDMKVFITDDFDFYFPGPSSIKGMGFGFTQPGYKYKNTPIYDSKGNLTYVKLEYYAISNPSQLYPSNDISINYNSQNQPVLIIGIRSSGDEFLKVEYQYNQKGELVLYERHYNGASIEKYEFINGKGIEEYEAWNGTGMEKRKTISMTYSDEHVYTKQFLTLTDNKWYMTHYTIYYPNDQSPNAEVTETEPIGSNNQGSFDVDVIIPVDSISNGSITVTFPEGFTLDDKNTSLTLDFAGNFELKITKQDNNSWLLEIKPKTTKSASLRAGEAKTILHVSYKVDEKKQKGTYDISVNSILFESKGGNYYPEPAITIPVEVTRWGVGNELTQSLSPFVYMNAQTIHVQVENTEQISVYSITGNKLYETTIQPGLTTINAASFPKGLLIVKGSRGWAMKLLNK